MKLFSTFIFITLSSICIYAQEINKEISENGKYNLLGKIDKQGLENGNYSWFTKNYNSYEPDEVLTQQLSKDLNNYELKLFMGTWCGDSKREVPKIYKLLESAKFSKDQLTTIAVGRRGNLYKKSPQHEEAGLNIHRVPTLIIYKNGKEINRIVEHPVESFEKDISNIINKNNYTSNYFIVTEIDNILKKKGIKGLQRKEAKLVKKFKNNVSSMYALNTYARILNSNNKVEEAIAVFRLNTQLFPNQPKTYMSLANTLGANNYKQEAIIVLQTALEKLPESKELKKTLKVIKTN